MRCALLMPVVTCYDAAVQAHLASQLSYGELVLRSNMLRSGEDSDR